MLHLHLKGSFRATRTKSEAAHCCEAAVRFDERKPQLVAFGLTSVSQLREFSWVLQQSRRAAEPGAFCWERSSQIWKRKKKNLHICLHVNQMLHRLAGLQDRRHQCVRKTQREDTNHRKSKHFTLNLTRLCTHAALDLLAFSLAHLLCCLHFGPF